jgi:hypothetical protein
VRKHALLSLSIPLAAVGCLTGHAVGYGVVGMSRRDAHVHGYLSFAPQFLAICAAFVAASLVLRFSGRLTGRVAAWPFALLPPLAFGAQELIERLAAGLPAHAVFEPAVFAGLAAQLPIALVAFLAARAVVRVTDAAARALQPLPPPAVLQHAILLVPASSLAPDGTSFGFDQPGRPPPRS